jgi:hypothetical protein
MKYKTPKKEKEAKLSQGRRAQNWHPKQMGASSSTRRKREDICSTSMPTESELLFPSKYMTPSVLVFVEHVTSGPPQ